RRCGFDCINTDLIAGLPGESFEMFRESLDMVCALGSENLTVHTMCVKRAADISDDDVDITHADHVNKMLGYAHEKTNSLGYVPYYMYRQKNIIGNLENVGYSKKGHEGIYNVKIMEEVQNIIALGGGGVSKIIKGDRIERVFNFKDASEYIGRFDEIIKRKDKVLSLLLG
ncbi:MAG: coproporphyrinogen dehydrogenase HemZ, partial [Oscillospiraceae bacterium]|nr:coproporphyrinogen dehydrogenase HemZ [Oscillospiraceae bacterium]